MASKNASTKRYSVRVEREIIVYAVSAYAAKTMARHYIKAGRIEAPAARDVKVLEVKRLPAPEKEEREPIIDVAPARETR